METCRTLRRTDISQRKANSQKTGTEQQKTNNTLKSRQPKEKKIRLLVGRRGGGQQQQTSQETAILNIMYLNARSIKSKLNELEILSRENNPDLILVTESWCSSEITNSELSIENYFIDPSLRQDRKDTSNGIGGGLLVYVKNGLKILTVDNTVDFNQYCRFNVLSDDNNVDFNVTLIYRSPNSKSVNNELLQLPPLLLLLTCAVIACIPKWSSLLPSLCGFPL